MKPNLYLDTTVPSTYFDDRTPDRQRLTMEFWTRRLAYFDPTISTIVLLEIRDTPDADMRAEMQNLISGMRVLPFTKAADELAQEYVRRGIFPEKYVADANHVAIAVTNNIDYFASWNFAHLVKVNTRREINLVNSLLGYQPIEIVAPPEL
jgi:hypothetical protein